MNEILVKTPQGEMSLQYLCDKECKRVQAVLNMIETEFNTSMMQHLELRKFLLDTASFIKSVPNMVSDVLKIEGDSK